jgi:hypothetical protein
MGRMTESNETCEFDCVDCGAHVVSSDPVTNDQKLCGVCQWLRGVADPVERKRLRAYLKELEQH